MRMVALFGFGVALLSCGLFGVSCATQKNDPNLAQSDSGLSKVQLEYLEGQLAAATKRIEELQRELSSQPECLCYQCRNVRADHLANRLNAVFCGDPDIRVSIDSDSPTNCLFVRGQPKHIVQAKEVLQRIDVPYPRGMKIIPVKHLNAAKAARIIQDLAVNVGDFRVSGDEHNRILIVSGARQFHMDVIIDMLGLIDTEWNSKQIN